MWKATRLHACTAPPQVFFSLLQPAPHTKAVPRQQAARCRATNAASVDAYNAGMAAAPQPAKHVPADAVTRSQLNHAMLLGNRGLGCGMMCRPYRHLPVVIDCLCTPPYSPARAVRCAWGKAQEASSLSVLLHLLPDCILHEVGLCLVDPADLQQRYGFSVGHLPPLGASPDGLLQRPATNSQPSKANASSAPSSRSKGTDPRAELLDLLQQMDHMDLQSSLQDVAADSSSFAEADLEVVEVKNTCPFGYHSKFSGAIAVVDQGPRDRVLPLWVPQLQMEMLAAGTQRALLVTRSATKGVTVFRMERDEGYIKAMLDVLAYLHKTYVLPRRAPGGQPYKEYAQYTAFLQHTKRVAKSAVVVLHDAHAHRFAPERNMRLMLDDAPCIDD